MRPLTALEFTDTFIAKVRTFEYVAVRALGALLAIPIYAKFPTYGICGRMLRMNV
jgi:hypothetical protein